MLVSLSFFFSSSPHAWLNRKKERTRWKGTWKSFPVCRHNRQLERTFSLSLPFSFFLFTLFSSNCINGHAGRPHALLQIAQSWWNSENKISNTWQSEKLYITTRIIWFPCYYHHLFIYFFKYLLIFTRYAGQLEWLNFRGEWGNAKNGCDLEPLSGECRLNHGPIFPGGPDDMPPPRIQRSRQTVTTVAPPPPLQSPPPPHYLAYTPTVPQFLHAKVPVGRASGLLNYRYKRRDPQSTDPAPVTANITEEPNQDSDSDPSDSGLEPTAKLANRLVTFVPEGSSTVSSWQKWLNWIRMKRITGEMETNAEDDGDGWRCLNTK